MVWYFPEAMAPTSSRRHADSQEEETEGLLHAPGREEPAEEEACSREAGDGGRAEDVEKPASTTSSSPSLVIPAATKSTVSGPLSPSSGGDGKASDMVSLCRICLVRPRAAPGPGPNNPRSMCSQPPITPHEPDLRNPRCFQLSACLSPMQEEDAPENLAIPCSCSGTQRWAHHSCIQQWVSEKGNIR